MKVQASKTPQDLYGLTAIVPGTRVQIQNRSDFDLFIFAGDAAPSEAMDYFKMPANEWMRFEGAVISFWSNQPVDLLVQESS